MPHSRLYLNSAAQRKGPITTPCSNPRLYLIRKKVGDFRSMSSDMRSRGDGWSDRLAYRTHILAIRGGTIMSRKHGQTSYYVEGEGFVGAPAPAVLGADEQHSPDTERAFRFSRM